MEYARSSSPGGLSTRRVTPILPVIVSIAAIICNYSCRGSGAGASGAANDNANATDQPRTARGPAAACDNAFYPAESGAIRNYKIVNRGTTLPNLTYSEQKANVTFGSFNDHREFSDGARTDAQWSCTADGLVPSEFSIPAVLRLSTAFKFDSISASGPAIPAADKWTPGYEWTTVYQVSGTENSPSSQSPGRVTGRIDVKSQIVSSEKVTVPAGSYDCFLVDQTIRESLRIEGAQRSRRPSLASIRVSTWYAKGVGMVRAAFSGDIGTGMEELTSVSK